jgi:hypothetical protein
VHNNAKRKGDADVVGKELRDEARASKRQRSEVDEDDDDADETLPQRKKGFQVCSQRLARHPGVQPAPRAPPRGAASASRATQGCSQRLAQRIIL